MSIPASQIVNVVPGVLAAGGTALDLSGVIITQNTRVPIGSAPSFPNALAVASYFGATSTEAAMASQYFLGTNNSTLRPAALIFYQYNPAPVGAYLRGGNIASFTLAQMQGAGGGFHINIDGGTFNITNLNLNSVTSQSAIAAALQTALGTAAPTVATFTASIASTNMTVSSVASGTLVPGQVLSGTSVTAGTTIVSQTSGTTGGTGVYVVSASQTTASTTITATAASPTVTYDTVSGGLVITSGSTGALSTIAYATGPAANALSLNAAGGGVLSQGAGTLSVTAMLNSLLAATTNWAGLTTTYEPTTNLKTQYAAWINAQNNDYFYAMWDTNSSTAPQTGDTSSAGYLIIQAGYSGTIPIWAPNNAQLAGAAVLGWAASINFGAPNGRQDLAFQQFPGLVPDVTDGTSSVNLITNGYNFVGDYATAAQQFVFMSPGSITGKYKWADSFVNQIWMNNGFQLDMMVLLTSAGSVPYNPQGYSMIESACQDTINAALNFGAIRSGVVLSSLQASEVTAACGGRIVAPTLSTRGWYLLVADPGASVREARGSPVCIFFYTDGQSVQQINFSSIDVL